MLVRLTTFLLALSVLIVTATVDLRAADSGIVTAQSKLSTAAMEDGPEGEEAPLGLFARTDGGDALHQPPYVSVAYPPCYSRYVDLANWASPVAAFPACAGFPTGPPLI
jgi:hypothetical protein